MISDEEAAAILIMLSRSQPPWMKQNVVEEPIVREDRLSFPVPRQRRRSFPLASSSSTCATAIVEYVENQDPNAHIDDGPLMESPAKPTRNRKKRPPLLPPVGEQPKQAKRKTTHRLAAEVSSSFTTEPTPKWLLELMTRKKGTELKKVIKKILTATDVSSGHSRLSMPFSGINDLNFLSPGEVSTIAEDQRKKRMTGVNVKLVAKLVNSDDLGEFDVNLRKWEMTKKSGSHTFVYNLVTGWNQVVQDCGLKEGDKICLWSFHSDDKLYFALAPPPSGSGNSKSEEISSALVIYDDNKSNDDLPSK